MKESSKGGGRGPYCPWRASGNQARLALGGRVIMKEEGKKSASYIDKRTP